MKSYYKEHKEEKREYQRKYRQEHKEEIAKSKRKYRKKHRKELSEYQIRYYYKRKIGRPYEKFGIFLGRRLKELDKTHPWLAEQLGISDSTTYNYLCEMSYPRENELRKKLCKTLKIKYQDLEDILNED